MKLPSDRVPGKGYSGRRGAGLKGFLLSILVFSASIPASALKCSAQLPPDPGLFYAGIWADSSRTSVDVCGEAGSPFTFHAWAWVPPSRGLTYITLRLLFPSNIELDGRPRFSDDFLELIVVDYGSGGDEWTVLFQGCPSGWTLIFSQDATILDSEESAVVIVARNSLARGCDFLLDGLNVLSDLSVNGPACSGNPAGFTTWGAVKSLPGLSGN